MKFAFVLTITHIGRMFFTVYHTVLFIRTYTFFFMLAHPRIEFFGHSEQVEVFCLFTLAASKVKATFVPKLNN